MDSKCEPRAAIKFLVAESHKPHQILERLQAVYGEASLGKTQVYEWCRRRFKEGRGVLDDNPRSGRPSTATSEQSVRMVEEIVLSDRRVTVEDVVDITGFSHGSVCAILHDHLKMRKVCAHWVPKLLQPDQRARRLECCQQLLQQFEEEGAEFLDRMVTQDETWMHYSEPESKLQSMQWRHQDSPRPRKALLKPSLDKVLYSFFWDSQGVILQWAVEQGATVTGAYHAQLLREALHPALKRERRGRITAGVLLQQDNAPASSHQSSRNEVCSD